MSGPISVIFSADPVIALLSAAAIRAAMAVLQGHAQAAVLRQEHEADRSAGEAGQAQAQRLGRSALDQACAAAETDFDQLITLAQRLGLADQVKATRPAAPQEDGFEMQAAHVRALQALNSELRAILLTQAALQVEQFAEQPAELALPEAPRTQAQRLLARIAALGVPEPIQSLAQELERCLPGARAELLSMELRARVQAHLEALQQQQLSDATGTIVEKSLKDLGYQVEEIGSTLFVEGGVVHFRRQGWGDYCVRLRVDAKAGSANFNVVRAVQAGQNERSVLDHLAEDRWCSEFPALLKTLAARGVQLAVTRRLEAGELPVQLVDAARLPKFSDEADASLQSARPLQRELP
jgi:hypothetical protein